MTEFDKSNKGSLFSNKNDKKDDRSPDYKGSALVGGQEYWISGWIKPTRDGQGRWMSLAFTPKQQQAAPAPQRPVQRQAPQGSGFDDMDSDIPF